MIGVENHKATDGNNYQPAPIRNQAADLYWLAYLLTGRRDVSIDIAADAASSQEGGSQFFGEWMRNWSRRLVMANALPAIREELVESERRTQEAHVRRSASPSRGWSLSPGTTKSQIEEALLPIDVFPRVALVLTVFEGVRIPDAATMLEVDESLVRKGQAMGLREFTANLAGKNPRPASGRAVG
jgi:DNA-directed RNA polymerase specialized sigma24 family protein